MPFKAASEARNGVGKVKVDEESETPKNGRISVGKKPLMANKLAGSKVRSDSKESSLSKNEDSKKKAKEEAERKKEEAKLEAERKREEAKAKKEEMDRKRKEDLEKKNQSKSVPPKGIAKQPVGKKGKDEGDNDDPIEKSLNERIALGGVT